MTPLTNRFTLSAIAILVGAISMAVSAQAQSPTASADQPALTFARAEFRLPNLLAQTAWNRRHPTSAGSNLTRAASGVPNATVPFFTITPAAASGPNLPVLGSGTLGRLTKWTGFTSGNSFIGDTTIFEDKYGNVGVGTDSPSSRLSVAGQIQSLSGGIKFPDGTVQTTAASSNALLTVAHDSTLSGNGTLGSPLGVNVPLVLSGVASGHGLIQVTSNQGFGIEARGGPGERGVEANGGNGEVGGGPGVVAGGGNGAVGGGAGVLAFGGSATNTGPGGLGADAVAGIGIGTGHSGGIGIRATGGLGVSGASDGLAGEFHGDVRVTGNLNVSGLTKSGGSFKIDHPLDPENKYLYHSFVESPDMKNIYDGTVTTDANGDAVVILPEWFEALNRDFRYQLTVMGTFAQAIVAEEIKHSRFAVKTNAPGVKVSWQVTGIRQDAWANKNRIPVEQDKPESERGYYRDPDAFDQPEEKGIEWGRNPEMMRQLKQRRTQIESRLKNGKQQ